MLPEQPKSWTGIRSSRAYGPVCPVYIGSATPNDESEFGMQHRYGLMDENCLNLNIWTRNINNNERKPVMVWLHGGGYSSGSSYELPTYNGLNLSKIRDVVVVSINHRKNVFGFLDLSGVSEKNNYSANVGMLDQVAALEWVQDNIQNFGGNPENVTIFGQSGGGGKRPRELSEKMSGALAQFMRTGDPNGGGVPEWPRYTSEKGELMFLEMFASTMMTLKRRPERLCPRSFKGRLPTLSGTVLKHSCENLPYCFLCAAVHSIMVTGRPSILTGVPSRSYLHLFACKYTQDQ